MMATYPRNPRTHVPSPSETAAEPPLGANEVVAAYVRGRTNAGLSTDPRLRGMCGRYARGLLAARSWDRTTLLEAVEKFGATNRSPRYVGEWCSQITVEREDEAHKQRKEAEGTITVDRGLHRISVSDVLARIRGAA